MIFELSMPALSPTMTEGKLISWNVKEGEEIKMGDLIAEVETDKALMEIESPINGTIGKLLVEVPKEDVKVNTIIALIVKKGGSMDEIKNYKISTELSIKKDNNNEQKQENNTKVEIELQKKNENIVQNSRIKSSPLAKVIANEKNIDLFTLNNQGSGPYGRIIKKDTENYNNISNKNVFVRNIVEYNDKAASSLRKTIAKKVTKSTQEIPHFYLTSEINVTDLIKAIEILNSKAKAIKDTLKKEYKISLNDAITKGVANALKDHKIINSYWDENGIIRELNNIDIAMAIATPDGGVWTPILQNVDQKNLIEVSKGNKEIIKKTMEGALKPKDYTGGSITISNMGIFNVHSFTGVINAPQSCILAVGKEEKKPIIDEHNAIKIGDILTIVYSADHRILDGKDIAKFANSVKEQLENPILLIN